MPRAVDLLPVRIVAISIAATFVAVGVWIFNRRTNPGPPVAEVERASRRVEANEHRNIMETYKITNRGGSDLILGDASTSCGCTIASIQSKVISPNASGSITLEGQPPDAGERGVTVQITSNAGVAPIELKLTMVGHRSPPFLVSSSGPVQFGQIRAGVKTESIIISTREREGNPWIKRQMVSPANLSVEGGLIKDVKTGPGIVYREYQYTIQINVVPFVGEFTGEVAFFPDAAGGPILTLPIHGSVRPKVFATPSSLYASAAKDAEIPALFVSIGVDDPQFDLKIAATEETLGAFTVRPLNKRENSCDFEIVPKVAPTGDFSTTLAFRTNHPEMGLIRVPITIRVD